MTLVEIMIVVIVMALIASGVAYAVVPTFADARRRQTETDVRALQNAVSIFMMQQGVCPTAIEDLTIARSARRFDPWGNAYVVACDIDAEPIVLSAGPDGLQGTVDDIVSEATTPSHE
jgi:general secretion pathway protein G